MFRDGDKDERLTQDISLWPVLNLHSAGLDDSAPAMPAGSPFRSQSAAPDFPAAIGQLLFAVYVTLIGALAVATGGSAQSKMVLTIAGLFVVAFFAVPHFIFAQEPVAGRRPTLSTFLTTGVGTSTGHCSGKAAMVQIFVVPVTLILGMLAIAVEIAVIL